MDAATEQTLLERIASQEEHLQRLERDLKVARNASMAAAIGQLRLHELCLVYVGDQRIDDVIANLRATLGDAAVSEIDRHVYDLSNAPLPHSQKQAVKRAFNHGMSRW